MGAIEAGLNLDARVEAARAAIRLAVHDAFPGRIALVSSFGAESAALLRLVADVEPNLPVIFLETGKHFAQTISYRKKIAAMFGLTNVIDARPDSNELAAQDPNGDLWRRDADACCALRKVRPLNEALDSFDAWITGRKQFQGGLRAGLPAFEASNGKVKVNPLTAWTPEDIAAFGVRAELPPHPLVAQGFASIGCWPCTKPIEQGEDQRAGRWRGADKTECGIHTI
ncbi:MAG: phosphoadenylyl-sulfate reductase [Pseudomonadota bacterium]